MCIIFTYQSFSPYSDEKGLQIQYDPIHTTKRANGTNEHMIH